MNSETEGRRAELLRVLIHIGQLDEEWRKRNGLHPDTNPALGMSPAGWRRQCRKDIEDALALFDAMEAGNG